MADFAKTLLYAARTVEITSRVKM